MDQGQADITVTPELLSAQTFRQKFVDLKAGLKYTFRVSQTLRGSLFNLVRTYAWMYQMIMTFHLGL